MAGFVARFKHFLASGIFTPMPLYRKSLAQDEFFAGELKGVSKTMRFPKIQIVLRLVLLGIAACVPAFSPPSNPTVSGPPPSPSSAQATSESTHISLPDLIVKFMYLELEGRLGNSCLSADLTYGPYGIRVIVQNIGAANAEPFFVELNGNLQEVPDGLQVDQRIELHFSGTIPSGQYEAIADATNKVVESREDNNTSSFLAPTPSPPPLCATMIASTATP